MHAVHRETNLPSTMFIYSASSCLSRLHSASCAAVLRRDAAGFQVMSESKEFRIHSARRVTSLSLQAVWAVLSRAGSCLCIPPLRSLHPRAQLKKPRNFLQTWGSVHDARLEKKGLKRLQTAKKEKKKDKEEEGQVCKQMEQLCSCFFQCRCKIRRTWNFWNSILASRARPTTDGRKGLK